MGASTGSVVSAYRLYPSVRLCMFLLVMLATTMLGGGFVTFNFSIVCMVNETAITSQSYSSDNAKASNNSYMLQCASAAKPDSDEDGYSGEFVWNKAVQSNLLAAHSYGALLGNIPSGMISERFGTRIAIAIFLTINGVAAAATPAAAYAGATWVFVVRIIQGLGHGATWPATVAAASIWGTAREAGTLLTLSAVGFQMGFLLAMATSSVICDTDYGWPMAFYLWSGLSILFAAIWLLLYTDRPEKCRFISKEELHYLDKCKMRKSQSRPSFSSIPWRRIFFSPCTIAIYVCQFSSTWATYYISVYMPTYSKEVLYMDVSSNGLMSALPSLCHVIGRFVLGPLGDKLSFCGRSKTFNIKFFTTLGTVLPALSFVLLGFLDCRHTALAVASFGFASFFLASSTAGYARGGMLIAPKYSGLIGAAYGGLGYVGSIIMPYAVGALASHGTVDEWKHTAFLTAAVMAMSFTVYFFCGTAEEQKWAKEDPVERGKVYVVDDTRARVSLDENAQWNASRNV